jgi:hypothetical protein
MRLLFLSLILVAGCSTQPAPASTQAALTSAQNGAQGDSADSQCDIVLRTAYVTFSSAGPTESCDSSGTCWVVVNGTVDISTSADQLGATPTMLFRSFDDGQWRSQGMTPIWGAALGFRRYAFSLTQNTFTGADGTGFVNLIPYLATTGGGRIFDHNRVPDPGASYVLSIDNGWSLQDDHVTCQGAAPHGIQTLVFPQGWQNSGYGTFVQSGKLDIQYDIYRFPNDIGCTEDGVKAFDVLAFVQWQPSGAQISERIDGASDPTTNRYASWPLEFDVPADATSASVWFRYSSDCHGNDYDSNFGANYAYGVAPQ